MMRPQALIVSAPGTNRDGESAFALELAGARSTTVLLNDLITNPQVLRESQMLAAEIPADIHQLHRVERAAPLPWLTRRVGALALKRVFHRYEAGARVGPPGHLEVVAHVRELKLARGDTGKQVHVIEGTTRPYIIYRNEEERPAPVEEPRRAGGAGHG